MGSGVVKWRSQGPIAVIVNAVRRINPLCVEDRSSRQVRLHLAENTDLVSAMPDGYSETSREALRGPRRPGGEATVDVFR